ncbi:MAG: hypothetical protein IVW55_14495 [Chloroflexi bacterium]|nr:hypothetical protein [Chloroflexota bacterium]
MVDKIDENDAKSMLFWELPSAKLYAGDCLQLLATLPASSVDLIFVDPPDLDFVH